MPEAGATILGILVLAVATYLTRVAGYLLGSRIQPDSPAGRILETLPGAALAGVLALAMVDAKLVELLAVAVAVLVFLWTGRTLPALGCGLLIAVANAHLAG